MGSLPFEYCETRSRLYIKEGANDRRTTDSSVLTHIRLTGARCAFT